MVTQGTTNESGCGGGVCMTSRSTLGVGRGAGWGGGGRANSVDHNKNCPLGHSSVSVSSLKNKENVYGIHLGPENRFSDTFGVSCWQSCASDNTVATT